jgi:hypothetical protein
VGEAAELFPDDVIGYSRPPPQNFMRLAIEDD